MKLFYQSSKYLQHSKRVARRAEKRRLERIERQKIERKALLGQPAQDVIRVRARLRSTNVVAPQRFTFLNNPEGVIAFLRLLEGLLLKRKRVFVVLNKVKEIDYGAITVLLSTIFRFKTQRVGFNGNFPEDEATKKLLVDSGFFRCLQMEDSTRPEYIIGVENQIITHAEKNVVAELGLSIMPAVTETIWGEKRMVKGLQRVLVELMQNTNNHASTGKKGDKYWWLSINHDKRNKKVSFVFMDHGVGIFSSLQSKDATSRWYGIYERIKNKLGAVTDERVLELLLDGQLHQSSTGDKFRGKGLPSIKEVLGRKQIGNLHVITNNVYADVPNASYQLLGTGFNGTFFYWELDQQSHNQVWTIN